jgi:hypothetical protein
MAIAYFVRGHLVSGGALSSPHSAKKPSSTVFFCQALGIKKLPKWVIGAKRSRSEIQDVVFNP